jgi:RsiW-degrading membrane proteinase PrsW (M82 family)
MSTMTFVYALLAGLIPSFIWLFFWTREDTHPEPRFLTAGCFLGGALAVLVAILAEKYVADIVSDSSIRYIAWAAIEEIAKFLAVAFIALPTKYNDEPIDAMMYCIVVALGFAALENMLFILGPLSDGDIGRSIITGNMRFIGATLVHIVSSATIGFSLGLFFYRAIAWKVLAAIAGLWAAIVLHAAFNLSIISGGATDTLRTFGWIWGAVVILIILFEEVKVVRPKYL